MILLCSRSHGAMPSDRQTDRPTSLTMHSAAGDAVVGVAYLLCRRRRNARRLEATINFRISHRSRSINWKLISHIVGRLTDSPSICGRVAPTNTETAWQCLASGRAPSSRWYVSSGLASACLQEMHRNGKKTSISTDRPINQRATPINSSEPVYTTDNATQLSVVFCFIVPRSSLQKLVSTNSSKRATSKNICNYSYFARVYTW